MADGMRHTRVDRVYCRAADDGTGAPVTQRVDVNVDVNVDVY